MILKISVHFHIEFFFSVRDTQQLSKHEENQRKNSARCEYNNKKKIDLACE